MYLKRLEMQGFKSFAKKADICFNDKLTIVVGPNGSGKSNIVDAIRWVLGEGSAKSLRGSKMEDVIFSGSSEKKPLGMAQVSLTLDNSTGIFPLEFDEITLTRRLYRSGESEYLINKSKCRQKDIHELIMDTGIGKDGFSIISQGKVDEILLSQAEDKRALVEEAAGIVKYRHRKAEANRKLKETQQSLVRIKDIVFELEEQKEPLEIQAKKAKEYKKFKEELDELEIRLALFSIKVNQDKRETLSEELKGLKKDEISKETKLRTWEASFEKNRFEVEEQERELSGLQEDIYNLKNELESFKGKVDLAEKMEITYAEQLERIQKELDEVTSEKALVDEKKVSIESDFLKASEEFEIQSGEISGLKLKIQGIKDLATEGNEEIEAKKGEIFNIVSDTSRKRNELISLEREEAVLNSRIESNKGKLKDLEVKLQDLTGDKEKLDSEYQKDKKNNQEIREHLKLKNEGSNRLKKKHKELEFRISNLKKEIEKNSARRDALISLEENKEGYNLGVKNVFAKEDLNGIVGTVSDLFKVESKYDLAIETALGGAIQNIVTKTDRDAKLAIEYLKRIRGGRATFLPINMIKAKAKNANPPENAKRAVEVLKFADQYENIFESLLGNIYIAENIDQALKINKSINRPLRFVTLDGDIINPQGSMTGGSYKNKRDSLLKRKREIDEIEARLESLKADLKERTDSLNKGLADQESLREEIKQKEVALNENILLMAKKENRINDLEKTISDEKRVLDYSKEEESDFLRDLGKYQSDKKILMGQIQGMEKDRVDLENALEEVKDSLVKNQEEVSSLEKVLNKKEIVFAESKLKKEAFEGSLNEVNSSMQKLALRYNNLKHEQEEFSSKSSEQGKNQSDFSDLIKKHELNLGALKKDYDNKSASKLELEEENRVLEKSLKEIRKENEALVGAIHSAELKITRIDTELENLNISLQENFQINFEDQIHFDLNEFDEKESKPLIKSLKRKIAALGEINLLAIKEYDKLLERYEFLSEQSKDLEEAKESLDKIIAEMDAVIGQKFKETFHLINEAFKEIFVDIFGGGFAELKMSDSANILETGIDIIAQPPGKTAKQLSLLSGGERAMTAICLLFAILKVKPSPFCVLDEIEASLDEANVSRFANFLKKFADITQFIVISHRKGTMEAADVLYGVTMEQKGISRLISVKVSDALQMTS